MVGPRTISVLVLKEITFFSSSATLTRSLLKLKIFILKTIFGIINRSLLSHYLL